MKDARIDRRLFLRGVGGVTAGLAAASALSACGTGTSRSPTAGSGKSSKTLVVRNSGGTYGDANQKAVYDALHQGDRHPDQGGEHRVRADARPDQAGPPAVRRDRQLDGRRRALQGRGRDRAARLRPAEERQERGHRRVPADAERASARTTGPASWRTAPTPSAGRSPSPGRTSGTPRRSPAAAPSRPATPTCPSSSSPSSPTAFRRTSCTRSTSTAPSRSLDKIKGSVTQVLGHRRPARRAARPQGGRRHQRLARPPRRPDQAGLAARVPVERRPPAEQRLRHPQGGREPRRRLPADRLRAASRRPGRLRRGLPDGPGGARRLQEALPGHHRRTWPARPST